MRVLGVAGLAGLAGVLLSLSGLAAAGEGFTDVSEASGVAAIVKAHYERDAKWWLSGMTLVDLDGDGDLDLHLGGHGMTGAAGFNDGKGRFTGVDPQMSIPRGLRKTDDLPFPGGEIRLVYDLDEDGRPDLLCSWGDGAGVIYMNDCKPGNPPTWNFKVSGAFNCFSRGTAMADINRDGLADYLVDSGSSVAALLGRSDGTFRGEGKFEGLKESGAIAVDINGDGYLDLLVSQRGYTPQLRRVFLNNPSTARGAGGKTSFTDITKDCGLDEAGNIMGPCDVDADGDLDLVCIDGKEVVIYLNDGKGRFTKGAPIEGMDRVRNKPTTGNWGGAVVTDFDNDGVADIILNGKYFLYVLRGLGGGKFVFMSAAWGVPYAISPAVDEGLCFGDIDGDGDLDLVSFGKGPEGKKAGVGVYRNDLPKRHWLRVQTVGAKGNRSAAGTKIRIYEPGGMGDAKKLVWFEQVALWGRQSFHSYYFAKNTERHFGLGDRGSVDVSVEFYPSGKKVEKRGVKADAAVEIVEP